MSDYNLRESGRERKIRLALIVGAFFLIVIGFIWPSSSEKKESDHAKVPMIQVQVLEKADADTNPIVVVSKTVDKKQLLILYEIEKNNDYFFNVQKSISLNDKVQKLFLNENKTGIWVQTVNNNEWILFSDSLEALQRNKEMPIEMSSSSVDFTYKSSSQLITVTSEEGVEIPLTKGDKPMGVHLISPSLWLIIFEDELQIAKGS
jgi:hypothetical protein